jgi:nitroreductase
MNLIDSLNWRYAVKKFDPSKKLSEAQIDLLKEAFNLTPTSFGLQPLKLIVIEDKELQEKFVKYSYFQRQVADASHLLVMCIDTDTTIEDINACFDLEKNIRGTSEEIIAPFREQLIKMYNDMGLEKRQLSAIYQCYIALGNLMTVCAIEKIDSCPMEGFIPEEIDKLLGLEKLDLKSILLLPVGYRADDDLMNGMNKVRKPLNEIIIDIKKTK